MRKFLSWLIAIPVAAFAVAFALDNRTGVSLGLWPLPLRIDVPVYIAVLGGLLLGFLAGVLTAWLQGSAARRLSRQRRRRTDQLERELAATKARETASAESPPTGLPRIAAGGKR